MPGSATTSDRECSCESEHPHVAFHPNQGVGVRKVIFEAQWPACAYPGRRFAAALTGDDARLGVDMTR